MSASLLTVVVDCRDPRRLAGFWGMALGYDVGERNPDEYQASDPFKIGGSLYFMKVPEAKVVKNRLHLDLVTDQPMEVEVARLVSAGARVVDVRRDPPTHENPDYWTVLQDPEGNEFCLSNASTVTGWA